MKRLNIILGCGLLVYATTVYSSSVVNTLEQAGKKFLAPVEQGQKIFPTSVEEKQGKLNELLAEKERLEKAFKGFSESTVHNVEEIKCQLEGVTAGLKKEPEDEFLNKKLALLNERYQVIKNVQQSREQLITLLDQHITLLQEYLKDPNLKEYKKDLKVLQKDSYTFEDLHQLNELIVSKEKNIAHVMEQEKNADTELESRKRTAQATAEGYKKKKEEQEKLLGPAQTPFDLGVTQKIELLKLEETLYTDKNERDVLRLQEIEQKKAYLKTKIFVEKLQLGVLKEILAKVKPAIKVSESDIAYAKDELAKRQQQSFIKKEDLHRENEALVKELKAKEKELQEMSTQLSINLGTDLNDWERQPAETVNGYRNFLEVANANDAVLLLQRKKELIDAQIALEDEQVRYEVVHIDVKNSFHKITEHAFVSEDEARQELKKYDAPRAETKANLALFKERRNNDQDRLARQKKALTTILQLRKKLQERKNTIFKTSQEAYTTCLELLNSAEERIQNQIEELGALLNVYSDIITIVQGTIKHIEFITSELELTTIWQRSKYAITWEGVQNIIPNIDLFIADVRAYLSSINGPALLAAIQDSLRHPLGLLLFLAALLAVLLIGKLLLPRIVTGLMHFGNRHQGFQTISFFGAVMLGFVSKHVLSLFLWSCAWASLIWFQITDPYLYILFYLISIPYLIYFASRFITYFARFNVQHGYIFLDKDFQSRFVIVISTFCYSTIFIVLFREAFVLAAYYKSELPTILLAVNFIIFQISLIFLIAKEQILSIIPEHGAMWEWLREQVDKYYYLILMLVIAIIVMSNPYVGFGKLVLYVLSRILYTLIVIRLLVWIHTIFKQSLSRVFFSKKEEVIRERFAYGKTLYGVFVLAVFVVALILGLVISAKIWGWPESFAKVGQWSDILSWLQTPLILEKTDNPISAYSILKILIFIIGGFMAASAINRFILDKIFDVLLAESGVQNTVSSIVRYLIIMMAVVFGFQSVGLGELVWWLILTLGVGIGWVIKDPVGDFIAYFIILVQRPVKIGDFVHMDAENRGVVRKITPRAVVLRRSNSVTIIIPNSAVISKSVVNWNYVRGFIAFDDIIITVAYKEDPAKVKELLLKVMDENTFILKSPNPIVRLQEFGQYGFVFMARGFLSSNYTLDQWDIASDVRLAMIKTLRQNGIQLALSTRIMLSKDGLDSQGMLVDEIEIDKNK
jgi:small-conductance mechanosensitive channel